jgi:CRISPR-associated endonuclease/helicase Cas3
MVQRFGRVNRFGDRDDTEIHVVHPTKFERDELDQRREKTLALIRQLQGDASPKALGELRAEDRRAAFAPKPRILPVSDILYDSWALTTIREKLPGRPPVEPYLHGLSERELPETYIAWREEVGVINDELRKVYEPEDLIEDYPLKPHELLRDRSDRVLKHLAALAALVEGQANAPVWIVDADGRVEPSTLGKLADEDKSGRINYRTVLLPPVVGGLRIENGESRGTLDGSAAYQEPHRRRYDVADEWRVRGEEWSYGERRHRVRVWDDDEEFAAKTDGMRLIRMIDTNPDADEEGDAAHRYWSWYESPESADSDGSRAAKKPVLWQVHTDDVVQRAKQVVQRLPLSAELRNAIIVAAQFHDLGKRRRLFQRIIGNPDKNLLLAKSGKNRRSFRLEESYRHEFGSMVMLGLTDEVDLKDFHRLSDEMKELVLHLIAAHHGRARPHFPTDEVFDPEPKGQNISLTAAAVPQRFARLQDRYGRWGLAYLESLLRAADYGASVNPSAFMEGE